MDLNNLDARIEDVYYSTGFMQLIEDHLTYLRTKTELKTVSVTNQLANKYQGDFYGLLLESSIPKKYHYIITRFNGYKSPSEFMGFIDYFVVPDIGVIEELKSLYLTTND